MNLIQMEWLTKSLKNLFKFNNISSHQANKIYKENYLCRIGSTSETVRDLEVYWNEHNNPTKKSSPSKRIKDNE